MLTFTLFAGLLLLFLCSPARAGESGEAAGGCPQAAAAFEKVGAEGTFVLYDVGADLFIIHNPARANERFVPASTFKIANALIGLSAGSVSSVDAVLPYGGQPQFLKYWENDMSLRDAIKVSSVPIFQELARRTGLERMRAGVEALDYGNGEIGTVIDRFWLEGPLLISAVEQARFLARLATGTLPFPAEVQAAVRDILLLEKTPAGSLYGKTGSALRITPPVGWWVGWVQTPGRLYAFALNMETTSRFNPAERVELGRACLKALGVYNGGPGK